MKLEAVLKKILGLLLKQNEMSKIPWLNVEDSIWILANRNVAFQNGKILS